jgi:hypothetical protein
MQRFVIGYINFFDPSDAVDLYLSSLFLSPNAFSKFSITFSKQYVVPSLIFQIAITSHLCMFGVNPFPYLLYR